ncbi:LacI family DNA-binding transcriptional regulator [Paractinoplanes abujensis]|uniref:DNA-binding LacI/PurR family transcriptional regulator n=1 Tax=Paractinoplanes abujensis TaxID=882441 RepID=A0A7W7CKB4_9ACTN|nr:LacI family DNA-binding transcriptional regulator [Actinoplanes abujensis]MBB4690149.1 DNA-binding LacI/PurR family transcriptional regulator [Actinoplanes abujensis]
MPAPSSPGRKRPTIRDVAREAGVSYATVSRVLNGREWVSPEAVRSVREAISRTGYTANPHARSLATGKSGSIAFLLTEPQHLLFSDPNFSVLLRGVAQALSDRELTLILMIASTPEERARTIAYLSGGHVDGVLLVSPHSGDPLLGQLVQAEVPIVACGRVLGYEQAISSVMADDRNGGRSAVDHLLAAGRTRIATITGPQDTAGGVDRLQGYHDALIAHGLTIDPALIVHGDWSRESGATAMRTLLEHSPDLDAVFAASDAMAAGALRVLREAGRDVPGDVRVVGFDDSGLAATTEPPLTTVRHPLDRVSEEMVRLLTDVIAGRTPLSITVPTTLVVRESSPA